MERILLASGDAAGAVSGPPAATAPVDLFVAFDDGSRRRPAFVLAAEARRAGLAAQLELAGRSLKGQLKHADRLGARFVAILSDDGAVLRDMESGEQRDVEASALLREVLRGRGPE